MLCTSSVLSRDMLCISNDGRTVRVELYCFCHYILTHNHCIVVDITGLIDWEDPSGALSPLGQLVGVIFSDRLQALPVVAIYMLYPYQSF